MFKVSNGHDSVDLDKIKCTPQGVFGVVGDKEVKLSRDYEDFWEMKDFFNAHPDETYNLIRYLLKDNPNSTQDIQKRDMVLMSRILELKYEFSKLR